jgi:hypothetical protein
VLATVSRSSSRSKGPPSSRVTAVVADAGSILDR